MSDFMLSFPMMDSTEVDGEEAIAGPPVEYGAEGAAGEGTAIHEPISSELEKNLEEEADKVVVLPAREADAAAGCKEAAVERGKPLLLSINEAAEDN